MVSMAAGMARRGALPIAHSFACFLSTRPNEQIYNQCSEGTKVIYAGSLAGVLPGGPGHSHQSVRDISALAAVPNLLMPEPAAEIEASSGSRIRVVNLPWLNRVDRTWLRETIGRCRTIITLDNHYVHGGQGEMLAAAVAELGLDAAARVTRIGVTELPECGTN